MCGRWLAFSSFTPIMEVSPTRNAGFWNLPRTPSYDAQLIAIWRLYARLHQRLSGYSYAQAREAQRTGMPIVRPLFLADPESSEAWTNWQTYLYGPDLLVTPIWEKGKREQTSICRRVSDGATYGTPKKSTAAARPSPCVQTAPDSAVHSRGGENQSGRPESGVSGVTGDCTTQTRSEDDSEVKAWFEKFTRESDRVGQ